MDKDPNQLSSVTGICIVDEVFIYSVSFENLLNDFAFYLIRCWTIESQVLNFNIVVNPEGYLLNFVEPARVDHQALEVVLVLSPAGELKFELDFI